MTPARQEKRREEKRREEERREEERKAEDRREKRGTEEEDRRSHVADPEYQTREDSQVAPTSISRL